MDIRDLFGQGPAPIEPGAANRAGAQSIFETHQAYVQAGFTVEQSMYLLGQMMSGAAMGAAIAAAAKPEGGTS